MELRDLRQGNVPVTRRTYDFYLRIGRQSFAKQLANHHRIVHHENADSSHRSLLRWCIFFLYSAATVLAVTLRKIWPERRAGHSLSMVRFRLGWNSLCINFLHIFLFRLAALDFESPQEVAQLCGDGGQLLRRFLRLLRARRSAVGGLRHSVDVGRDVAGSAGRFAGVAHHLIGGCALFFDRGRDGRGNVVNLVNHAADRPDGRRRTFGVRLNGRDFVTDVFGGLGRLLGQLLDFVGDHGKTFASFSGARGFDGCVQSQQVGLLRDRGDDFDDDADLYPGLAQLGHGVVGGLPRVDGGGGNFGSFIGFGGDVLSGRSHLAS